MWGMEQMPAALAQKQKHVINKPHTIIDKKTPGDCFASLAMTTACPAHHLELAFLPIKNVELAFTLILTKIQSM